MYYYNYYYPPYQYPYAPRPVAPPVAQFVVTDDTIKNALKMHPGECFSSYWNGKYHTFNLTGFDPDGTVHIIENSEPSTIHQSDMVEFKYIGVKCPSSTSESTTGPSTGSSPGHIPNCYWTIGPYGNWVWVCS